MSRVAVLTIVHGRHQHLARLLEGLARSTRRPDLLVVAAMQDPAVEPQVLQTGLPAVVVELDREELGLPLAAARNLAAATAIAEGADVLVFLDVDCIPSPELVGRYVQVLQSHAPSQMLIAAGEVAYLPASDQGYPATGLDELAQPHPARPVLDPQETRWADGLDLFWSLSFAMTAPSWSRTGGFDTSYVGYGAEDTDFALRAEQAGARMIWVGGARAYHQYHDNPMPPVHHLDDIVRNSRIFHDRWGRWPMRGWLQEFDRRGMVRFDGQNLTVP